MSGVPSARAIASARRRERRREVWREFASHRSGVIGLIILVAVVALALLAPIIAPSDRLDVTQVDGSPNEAPSWAHPLGTEPGGRGVLAMLIWGARISLLVGFSATAVSVIIGTVVGMAAGHFGGAIQAMLLRIIDFFLVVPSLVLAIVLSTVLQRGVVTIVIAIGLTSWATTARLVRSQTLTIEARPYIERAWALGASDRHVVPSTCSRPCCRWCSPTRP